MAERHNLAAIIRGRLRQLQVERRLKQTAIAQALGVDPSSVNKTIRDDTRPLTITFLEAVAEYSQVPLAELIAPPSSTVKQLDPLEAAIVRALREWPQSVREHLADFLAFFLNERPVDLQARNLAEYWRGMDAQQRRILFALAQLLRERALGPDLLAGLEQQVLSEATAAKRSPSRPPRTPHR